MHAEALKIETKFARHAFDVIIIGSGPAGIRAAQEIIRLKPETTVGVFGDEPWSPYNRVKLSSLISGQVSEASLYDAFDLSSLQQVSTFYNKRIEKIDRYAKQVVDINGSHYSYDELIIATGSRARVPEIEGVNLDNVFTFRNLNDAQKLMGRSVRTRKTVIIGGGLLGLETARAMQRFNTEVHVIEHSLWLLFNQLDNRAGSYLKQYIETLGIYVHVGNGVKRIQGTDKVNAVELHNGETIECDTVILAVGITPNSTLAFDAGLAVGKGIRVNDQLQTTDKNIYAIGECAEHNNQIYGLVAPGLEQAAVVAHHLNREKANYKGSTSSTHLKVLDYPVISIGETGANAREREEIIFQDHQQELYRKIIVINGRIRGAVGIGDWPGVNRFQEAIEKKRRVWPWQIARFREEGLLWNDALSDNVIDWPATATVCNCTGVTRGQLDDAMKRGACTVNEISCATGASTVCGSCKNLVADFVGGNQAPEPVTANKPLLMASLLGLLAIVYALLLPAIPFSNTVSVEINWDQLWRDSFFKQVSGFSLLGLSLVISVISLRKRFRNLISLWDYAYWRVAHVVFGLLTIGALLVHTGFSLGDNINFYLMIVFSSLILVGTIAGTVIGYEHLLPGRIAKQIRSYAIWSHILLLWPLPALLGFHILKTYYF